MISAQVFPCHFLDATARTGLRTRYYLWRNPVASLVGDPGALRQERLREYEDMMLAALLALFRPRAVVRRA